MHFVPRMFLCSQLIPRANAPDIRYFRRDDPTGTHPTGRRPETTLTKTTKTRDKFDTLDHAYTFLYCSSHWDWGPVASWVDWCDYAYMHGVETIDAVTEESMGWNHDECLTDYLRSVGVDPADFQL